MVHQVLRALVRALSQPGACLPGQEGRQPRRVACGAVSSPHAALRAARAPRPQAPTWHEVGDELNDTDGVHVGQVDCVRSKALCSRYGVRGFPTLKHFSPGEEGKAEVRDYSGSRTTNACVPAAALPAIPARQPRRHSLCPCRSLVEYAKGGWEAAQPSRVGDQAQDGDGPGLIHDMMVRVEQTHAHASRLTT